MKYPFFFSEKRDSRTYVYKQITQKLFMKKDISRCIYEETVGHVYDDIPGLRKKRFHKVFINRSQVGTQGHELMKRIHDTCL